MKVRELLEQLQNSDPELEIYRANDDYDGFGYVEVSHGKEEKRDKYHWTGKREMIHGFFIS